MSAVSIIVADQPQEQRPCSSMGRKKLPEEQKRVRKTVFFDRPTLARIETLEKVYYPNHDLSSIVRIAVNIGLLSLDRDPSPLGMLPIRSTPPMISPATGTPQVGGMTTGTFIAAGGQPREREDPEEPPAAPAKKKKPRGPRPHPDPTREPTDEEMDRSRRGKPQR